MAISQSLASAVRCLYVRDVAAEASDWLTECYWWGDQQRTLELRERVVPVTFFFFFNEVVGVVGKFIKDMENSFNTECIRLLYMPTIDLVTNMSRSIPHLDRHAILPYQSLTIAFP